MLTVCVLSIAVLQAKKKHYDVELENLEKHQKQTIERMETDHAVKLKEETKRIKSEQDRDYHKFQDQLKHRKKEVIQHNWWNASKQVKSNLLVLLLCRSSVVLNTD